MPLPYKVKRNYFGEGMTGSDKRLMARLCKAWAYQHEAPTKARRLKGMVVATDIVEGDVLDLDNETKLAVGARIINYEKL